MTRPDDPCPWGETLHEPFPPSILFDDGVIRVVHQPGSGRGSLLTFADLTFRPDGTTCWGSSAARRLGYDLIGVVGYDTHWYPAASIEAAAPFIRPLVEATTVAYGYSMGGHAALRHARRLGVDYALAVAPQFSIDPAVMPEDLRYSGLFRPKIHRGLRISHEELPRVPFMIADPYFPQDSAQARAIVAAGSPDPGDRHLRWVHTPFVEHWAIHLIRSSWALEETLENVLADDPAGLRRVLRRSRRTPVWHRVVAREAMVRGRERHAQRLWPAAIALGCPETLRHADERELAPDMIVELLGRGGTGIASRAWPLYGGVLSGDLEALRKVGHALIAHGFPAEAAPFFRAALLLAPADGTLWHALSTALVNEPAESLAVALEGRERVPGYAPLAMQAGYLLSAQGELDAAEAQLRDALRLDRRLPGLHAALSHLLANAGRLDEALVSARQAYEAAPGDVSLALQLARLQRALGHAAAAIRSFRAVLRLEPANEEAARELALLESSGTLTKLAGRLGSSLDTLLGRGIPTAAPAPRDPGR
ncbi:tetratricopeptide repeat protein [Roseomonas elaeocarpi]|uniref:Alpha/beta hydrolase n=1 Tax=Roseomonas elaeocarpi TaxID=907779 RepID=A0ABV6JQX4_9PROT